MSSAKKSSQTTRDMLGRQGLMSVVDAREKLLNHLSRSGIGSETIPLEQSLGRISANTITSPENLPQHPRSTMDGYAVIAHDTFGATESMPCYLSIAGDIPMGKKCDVSVSGGDCFRIATGGLLPPGADAVVMFEHTVPVDESMIEVVKSVGKGANIIQAGDDIAANAEAIPAGKLLRSQDLGLLAGLGITKIEVSNRIRVGILSTGDEIIPFSAQPQPGEIRNINSIVLASEVRQMGGNVNDYGIVKDSEDEFFGLIEKARGENDLLLFSGGSSVGMRDLGEKAIESLGTPGVLVHGVALKPGKPIIIGLHDNKPIFGLPGHPVSAMVCFDLFVRPAIRYLAGLQEPYISSTVKAQLGRNMASAAGRMDIVRVRLCATDSGLVAEPVLGKSGSISTLSRAHGYFIIAEQLQGVTENSEIEVILYQ